MRTVLFLMALLWAFDGADTFRVGDKAMPFDRLKWERDHGLESEGPPDFGWVIDVEHTWFGGPSLAPKRVLFQARRDPNVQIWVESRMLWAAGTRQWGAICRDYQSFAPGTIVGFGDTMYGRPRRPGVVVTSACTASSFDPYYVIRPLDGLWEASGEVVADGQDVVPWRAQDCV